MPHYRCYIKYETTVAKQHNGLLERKRVNKRSKYYYVTASTPDQARSFIEAKHVPTVLKDGDTLRGIVATKWSDDKVMKAIHAPSLFPLD